MFLFCYFVEISMEDFCKDKIRILTQLDVKYIRFEKTKTRFTFHYVLVIGVGTLNNIMSKFMIFKILLQHSFFVSQHLAILSTQFQFQLPSL